MFTARAMKKVLAFFVALLPAMLLPGCSKRGTKHMSESSVNWFLRWGDDSRPAFQHAADAAASCTLFSAPESESGCALDAAQQCLTVYRTEMCRVFKKAHEYGSVEKAHLSELRRAYARNVKHYVDSCSSFVTQPCDRHCSVPEDIRNEYQQAIESC